MPNSEHPSIEELRALVLLAEKGSVGAAADELGIKQPVASNRLKVFRTGEPLLRTRGNRVDFTEKGQSALPAIRDLLRRYDHIKQYLAGERRAPHLLRVGTGSSVSQYYLARAIGLLRERLADWEIETQVARGENRILGVADGTYDLAIVSHDRLQIETLLYAAHGTQQATTISELGRQPLCVLAPVNTPEAAELRSVLAGQQVPLEKLCHWRIVGLDPQSGVRRQIERQFAARDQGPIFGSEAGGWPAVKEHVRQGLGVGLVPLALLFREDREQFVIRRLSSDVFLGYWLVYRPSSDNHGLTELVNALHIAADEHQEEVDRTWSGLI